MTRIEGWKCPKCKCNMLMKWVSGDRSFDEEIGKRCLNCGAFFIKSARRRKNWAKGYSEEAEKKALENLEDFKKTEQDWLNRISESEKQDSAVIEEKPEKVHFRHDEIFFKLGHLLDELDCSSILELAIKYHRLVVKQEWANMDTDTTNYEDEIHQMFVERWNSIEDGFINFKRV